MPSPNLQETLERQLRNGAHFNKKNAVGFKQWRHVGDSSETTGYAECYVANGSTR